MNEIFNRGIPSECNITIGMGHLMEACLRDDVVSKYKEKYNEKYEDKILDDFVEKLNKELLQLNNDLYHKYIARVYPTYFTIGINDNMERYMGLFPSVILDYILRSLNITDSLVDGSSQYILINKIYAALKKIHFKRRSQIKEYENLDNLYDNLTSAQKIIIPIIKMNKKVLSGDKRACTEKINERYTIQYLNNKYYLFETNNNETTTCEIDAIDTAKNKFNLLRKYGLYEKVSFDDILKGKEKISIMTEEEFSNYVKNKISNAVSIYENECEMLKTVSDFQIKNEVFEEFIDKDKFALLVAAMHLSSVYKYSINRTVNLSYVAKYLSDVKDQFDNEVSINLLSDFDGNHNVEEPITNRVLNDLYVNFIINHPEVPIMNVSSEDFKGKTLEEIDEIVKEQESSINVDFDFLVNDENTFNTRDGLDIYKYNVKSIDDEEKKRRIEAKIRILEEKLAFFEDDSVKTEKIPLNDDFSIVKQVKVQAPGKTNLSFQIYGKNKFAGYIGYVYGSGIILMEKYYKDDKQSTPDNYAMYVMDITEFLELCQKSKTEIICDKLCDRISHNNGWQDKAMEIINVKPSEQTLNSIQQFKRVLKNK